VRRNLHQISAALSIGAETSRKTRFRHSRERQRFILLSRLQPGCAESAIVNGILSLIDSARDAR